MRHHVRQVAVRGGDHTDVHAERPRAAEALELVLLQHAEDLGLRVRAHVADFVQEQRAAVRLFEPADPLLVGAREGPLLVPEELRLEQVLLQRRAVHLHEVPRCPKRVVVRGAGDQLLAGARFPPDQDGRVALRDFLDDAQHGLQPAVRADDPVEVVDVPLRVPEVLHFVPEAAVLDGLVDLELHLLDLERLLHVVEGADLHRLHRRVHRSERRHQDDGRGRVQRLGGPQDVEAVTASHLQIAEHDVVLRVLQFLDGDVAVRCLVDIVLRLGQGADDAAAEKVVVVGYQDAAHECSSKFSVCLHVLPSAPGPGRRRRGRARTAGDCPSPAG